MRPPFPNTLPMLLQVFWKFKFVLPVSNFRFYLRLLAKFLSSSSNSVDFDSAISPLSSAFSRSISTRFSLDGFSNYLSLGAVYDPSANRRSWKHLFLNQPYEQLQHTLYPIFQQHLKYKFSLFIHLKSISVYCDTPYTFGFLKLIFHFTKSAFILFSTGFIYLPRSWRLVSILFSLTLYRFDATFNTLYFFDTCWSQLKIFHVNMKII